MDSGLFLIYIEKNVKCIKDNLLKLQSIFLYIHIAIQIHNQNFLIWNSY